MTVDEVREFVADSVDAAVAKAADHFGVPAARLEVRELGEGLQVSGLGASALILAAVREEATPLGPVGEFVAEMAQKLAPDSRIRVEESESDGLILVRVGGEELSRVLRRSTGVGAALSHLAQRAAQKLVSPEASARVEVVGDAPARSAGGGRSRPPRRREGGGGGGGRADGELEARAREVAEEVRSTGQPQTLGRMTSRERFIVHNAIRDIDGVTSESVGDASDKRVKIVRE